MAHNAHDAYLESRVLSADPTELISLLYQAAISHVREARRHLEAKDIRARSKSITKAQDILVELTIALDRKRGEQIAENLRRLYDYILRRMAEANFKQVDQPLRETLGLLTTLQEGWDGARLQAKAAPEPGAEWTLAAAQDTAGASQAWSF